MKNPKYVGFFKQRTYQYFYPLIWLYRKLHAARSKPKLNPLEEALRDDNDYLTKDI